jgi:hypothetical protein
VREHKRQVQVDDAFREKKVGEALVYMGNAEYSEEDLFADLESALSKLPSREQFVMRAGSGVHQAGALNVDGVHRLAVMVRLNKPRPAVLRRRAQLLLANAQLPPARISAEEIGHLLEIGERQVRNIKKSALIALQHDLRDSRA